jgi:internalin A
MGSGISGGMAVRKRILDQAEEQNPLLRVRISSMGLNSLPNISKICPFATSLDASNNIIRALPDSLLKLPHISILDVSTNQLSILPEFLSAMLSLTDLRASDNNLHRLPDSLVLPSLTSLSLCRNYLEHALPALLCESFQSSLKVLRMSSNGLSHITAPASVVLLTALIELDLSINSVGGETL